MKRRIRIFVFIHCYILVFFSIVQGQVDTLWTKTFGGIYRDYGNSVQQTSDGGYIITGYTESFGNGYWDVMLIKTDALGDTIWVKYLGGVEDDYGNTVRQTKDGGYIIVGCLTYFGSPDLWLIKTDASGEILWTKIYGTGGYEWCPSVEQTNDDGYIITGSTPLGAGWTDVWLIKTNAFGDTLWTKTYGGNYFDDGNSVQQTTDSGYVIVGRTSSFGAGNSDVWLIKTDASGDTMWTKTFGGIDEDFGNSVQQTTDGGYILTGRTQPYGPVGYALLLIKTNAFGDTFWTKIYGADGADWGNSVQQTIDGGYIITGVTNSYGSDLAEDMWLIKTDSSGDTLWTKTYGRNGFDSGNSVQQTTDGGYIITGNIDITNGMYDAWLIKTTPDVSDIEPDQDLIVSDFILSQNYPNPFNPNTVISYRLPVSGNVTLKVYDILGNEVATLVNEEKPAGEYEVEFSAKGGSASGGDAYNLPSGIYFYQLKAGAYSETKKMILIK